MGSEYGEDLWVMQHIKLPDSGFYLDLGCAWPEQYSNTAFLRKRGWRGLCVDANPLYAQDWKGVETFVCAVIGDGTQVRFKYEDAPDLSRVTYDWVKKDKEIPDSKEGIYMQSTSLRSLIEECPKIDFISCDLEGHEMAALSNFPWSEQLPKCIVSEFSTHNIGEDFRVRDMLLEIGYVERHRTVANIIFELQ